MTRTRRRYLASLAAVGAIGGAGCLDSVPVIGNDETALGAPETSRGDPIHPIHGEAFPAFDLPDPFAGTTVSLDDLEGTPFAMTFIYTSCTDQCGALMQLLRLIQSDAEEQGYSDEIELLAMTFDPETDTEAELESYADLFDLEPIGGNFSFLRPETNDEALEIINEDFGVPAEVHDDDDDHDHGDEDDEDAGPGVHYYMLFLVNGEGIVERSYPNVVGAREETRPNAIIEDVRTVTS